MGRPDDKADVGEKRNIFYALVGKVEVVGRRDCVSQICLKFSAVRGSATVVLIETLFHVWRDGSFCERSDGKHWSKPFRDNGTKYLIKWKFHRRRPHDNAPIENEEIMNYGDGSVEAASWLSVCTSISPTVWNTEYVSGKQKLTAFMVDETLKRIEPDILMEPSLFIFHLISTGRLFVFWSSASS